MHGHMVGVRLPGPGGMQHWFTIMMIITPIVPYVTAMCVYDESCARRPVMQVCGHGSHIHLRSWLVCIGNTSRFD